MPETVAGHALDYMSQHHCIDLIGRTLGQTIAEAEGQPLLDIVEHIRILSKAASGQDSDSRDELIRHITSLDSTTILNVARAFSQFLNLANIVEQLYSTLDDNHQQVSSLSSLATQIQSLKGQGVATEAIQSAIKNIHIDLVLTAHPTEIIRRTLIEKQDRIYRCLQFIIDNRVDAAIREKMRQRFTQLVAQWWHTDNLRSAKPSPIDEAKGGLAVVENSLWDAVPEFINTLESDAAEILDLNLPIDYSPVCFTSWMGGDRDGNPLVTADVTREVLVLSLWKASDLYLKDIHFLSSELSMQMATEVVQQLADGHHEPYRAVLKKLRTLLTDTQQNLQALLDGETASNQATLETEQQLWEPLYACYESLHSCGMGIIANGRLKDTLRRIKCFGIYLIPLDIRQESDRHTEVLSELTRYLDLGDYQTWPEADRLAFLATELTSKRPLLPQSWQPGESVQEVLDTFAMIAEQPAGALGAYVISMARNISDVLAVQLLLKANGCKQPMPIAPLFETLDDLNHAAEIISSLLSIPVYRDAINDRQMVVIGYSDSAKDAGTMAASWAQYRAQEALLDVCKKARVQLKLFHGRGGSIGRGGAPAHAALLSQPPGSLETGLRVTEQGEVIRFKLGLPETTVTTLGLYTNAILQSNLTPPPEPSQKWRTTMDQLSDLSAKAYRSLVRNNPDFIPYFHAVTPIDELGKLPIGSRPSKRNQSGGLDSLRAIPWIFSWSQNRLMLPAWLGAGEALETLIRQGQRQTLEAMSQTWPFFASRLSMLEMVYSKADPDLSQHYDTRLAATNHKALGQALRSRLRQDIETVLSIRDDTKMMQDESWLKQAVRLRNTYIDPLNLLQIELLDRNRTSSDSELERALMISITGIAAGMRNTG